MPLPRRARVLATGSALVLTAGLLLTTMPAAADPPDTTPTAAPGRYIVTLTGSPIATYAGEVKGYKATRPTEGRQGQRQLGEREGLPDVPGAASRTGPPPGSGRRPTGTTPSR